MQQAFVNLRSGRPSKLPPPVPGYLESWAAGARDAGWRAVVQRHRLADTVRRGLQPSSSAPAPTS
jgi:hypothetical protein